MICSHLLLALTLQIAPDAGFSATVRERAAPSARTFSITPEGDDVLAATVATGPRRFSGDIRRSGDSLAVGFMQQSSQISRIQMDAWWSQTGAALIANNLLSADR